MPVDKGEFSNSPNRLPLPDFRRRAHDFRLRLPLSLPKKSRKPVALCIPVCQECFLGNKKAGVSCTNVRKANHSIPSVWGNKVKDFYRIGATALALSVFLVTGFTTATQPAFSDSKTYQKDLTRGLYQMVKKDYESAVASFTLVLRDNPNVYEAYLNRAAARSELKDYEGALADYDQAIKINPNVVESFIKRGELHAKQNDYAPAVEDYSQALRLSPKNSSALMNRAAAYKKIGDYQKAINDYSTALKLDPGSFDAIKERADCRALSNDLDGAIEDYEYLLKKNKSGATALRFQLAEVQMKKGNKGSAEENFKQVIAYYSKNLKGSRKNGEYFLQRGLAYAQLGETDKAIADLQEASAWKADEATTR